MFNIFQENKTIQWIFSQRKSIDFSPSYQRLSSLWGRAQKQLLIDSILNGFDIPKLYFQFMPDNSNNAKYIYGIIDGQQRLQAIIDFIEDRVPLSNDFRFMNPDLHKYYKNIAGKKFSEIDKMEPMIIAKFWQYELSIVFMDTDEPETITETFIRLNSGINVNTAEKRNASGGILSREIKNLCENSIFFTKKLRINNTRYTHLDLALKLLMIIMGYDDLSRKSVDRFVEENKLFEENCRQAFELLKEKLRILIANFDDKDVFLAKKSLIITMFSIMDEIPDGHIKPFISYFENLRLQNTQATELENTTNVDANMIEFSRHLQQGADKKISLDERKRIIRIYLQKYLENI